MLAKINTRLRQGFSENRNIPFGERSIILFSDFGQLPPMLDLLMYTTNISQDELSNNGIVSYKSFSEACKLDVIEKQSRDSEKQQTFKDILLRMRDGKNNKNDWIILTRRFKHNLSNAEWEQFSDAVHILTK
ncbi:hypothetical protein RclHR1_20930006 [Rhizophagus clarus]|uniref:ATP-dependent DNA helicase n=1 Tax=Rhizophagus clarus TaxID=94130 RepID=A0A2Z6QRC1_9GLOM|nr:hypothetical protein RclHR1_20930006 [Rhizophagus clarus]GES82762.1 ATP-dependent DNA helicase Pif1-like [Rhizophagus clarus]